MVSVTQVAGPWQWVSTDGAYATFRTNMVTVFVVQARSGPTANPDFFSRPERLCVKAACPALEHLKSRRLMYEPVALILTAPSEDTGAACYHARAAVLG